MCQHSFKKFELTKLNYACHNHSTFGIIHNKIPKEAREEAQQKLIKDNQLPLSALLSIVRKYNLNLPSKQTNNLKDKNCSKREKLLKSDDEFDKMLCDSTLLNE